MTKTTHNDTNKMDNGIEYANFLDVHGLNNNIVAAILKKFLRVNFQESISWDSLIGCEVIILTVILLCVFIFEKVFNLDVMMYFIYYVLLEWLIHILKVFKFE